MLTCVAPDLAVRRICWELSVEVRRVEGSEKMEILDLSISVDEDTRVQSESTGYSDPPVKFETWLELEHKYHITKIEMGAHAGTHVDVPCHLVSGGKTTSDYAASTWVGWAVVMDFQGKGPISPEMIMSYKERIVGRGYVIPVLRNGVTDPFTPAARGEFLSWKPQVAIMGEGINLDELYEDSMAFLQAGVPMIMNANHKMVALVQDGDLIVAAPIKFTGLEAAPMRLLAIRGVAPPESWGHAIEALEQSQYEEQIAELERMVGKLMMELESAKSGKAI
jgi:arylformamidase